MSNSTEEKQPKLNMPDELINPTSQATINGMIASAVQEAVKGVFAGLGPVLEKISLTPEKLREANKPYEDPEKIKRERRDNQQSREQEAEMRRQDRARKDACAHKDKNGKDSISLVHNFPDHQVRGVCMLCGDWIFPTEWRIAASESQAAELAANRTESGLKGKAYIVREHRDYHRVRYAGITFVGHVGQNICEVVLSSRSTGDFQMADNTSVAILEPVETPEISGDNWEFRLALSSDAPAFAKWAAENPLIDHKDLEAGLKANNPTCVTFCACKNGVPIVFTPVFCTMNLAYLGLNPDARASEKLKALEVLTDGATAFAVQFGVREIQTLTLPEYTVAKWALAHGFEADSRQVFKLDINKILAAGTVN